MTSLTDFLLARIAEDEADGHNYWCSASQVRGGKCDCPHTRVLAECEAKRRIAEAADWDRYEDPYETPWGGCGDSCEWKVAEYMVHLLALPYANHPDYREDWRP